METGVHWVGEMGPSSKHRLLMDYISDWQLDWVPMDDVMDAVYIMDKDPLGTNSLTKYEFHRGPEKWKEHLKRTFPKEHKGIDK